MQGIADRVCLGLLPSSECSWLTAVRALRSLSLSHTHTHTLELELQGRGGNDARAWECEGVRGERLVRSRC